MEKTHAEVIKQLSDTNLVSAYDRWSAAHTTTYANEVARLARVSAMADELQRRGLPF